MPKGATEHLAQKRRLMSAQPVHVLVSKVMRDAVRRQHLLIEGLNEALDGRLPAQFVEKGLLAHARNFGQSARA